MRATTERETESALSGNEQTDLIEFGSIYVEPERGRRIMPDLRAAGFPARGQIVRVGTGVWAKISI